MQATPAILCMFKLIPLFFVLVGVGVICYGVTMMNEGKKIADVEWLKGRCRIQAVGTEAEQASDCSYSGKRRCSSYTSCGGISSSHPEWEGPCGYPCCGFTWYYGVWTVVPLCDAEDLQCFQPGVANGTVQKAYWCAAATKNTLISDQANSACKATHIEGATLKNSHQAAPVGSEIPCYFDEQRTNIKLNGAQKEESGVAIAGILLVLFGSIFSCCACCFTCIMVVMLRGKSNDASSSASDSGNV